MPMYMYRSAQVQTQMQARSVDNTNPLSRPSPALRETLRRTQAVEDLTLETTGKFIAPQGSKSLGLGLYALDNPDNYGPFCELPW